MSFDPKELHLYPEDPGVYLMKDAKGEVLYIGKAKNLKVRLKQYFGFVHDKREMVPYLTAQVASIDTIIALTEKDALILENTLIKKHKPKYNVLLKDDKTFISLMLTSHKWPSLKLTRFKGKPTEKGEFFGPYTNALAARQMYDVLSKIFPLRQCSDHELMNRSRPCLLYDIKRCIAPCCNLCTEEEYKQHVDGARKLLKGKDQDLMKELEKQMIQASDDLLFEKALELKNILDQIKNAKQKQLLDFPQAKDSDAIGIHKEGDAVLLTILLFRSGKMIGSEHFSFHLIASTEEEILTTFLLQHYKSLTQHPKEILIPIPLSDQELLQELISESANHTVSIQVPKAGRKDALIEMAQKNASALFIRERDVKSHKEKILLELAEILNLHQYPSEIHCIDTSNISGSDPTASVVAFIEGEYSKSKSKIFSIKDKSKADDYSAMKEVIYRYLKRCKEKNAFCDLLILDGGKGQLGIATQILEDLSIANLPVIALAKEESRHDKGLTQERIFMPGRNDPISLDPRSNILFFLQKIRDAAHKKAITYHKLKRSKRLITSALDEISGIGPVKKQRLLKTFGSVQAIKNASSEDLAKVPGLTTKDIDLLKTFLKEKT